MTYEQFSEQYENAEDVRSFRIEGSHSSLELLFAFSSVVLIASSVMFGVHSVMQGEFADVLKTGRNVLTLWWIPGGLAGLGCMVGFLYFKALNRRRVAQYLCQSCQMVLGRREARSVIRSNICPSCSAVALPCEEKGVFVVVPVEEVAPYQSASHQSPFASKPVPGKSDQQSQPETINLFAVPWVLLTYYLGCFGRAAWHLTGSQESIAADSRKRLKELGLNENIDENAQKSVKFLRRQSILWMLLVFVLPNTLVLGFFANLWFGPRENPAQHIDYTATTVRTLLFLPLALGVCWAIGGYLYFVILNRSPQFVRIWLGAMGTAKSKTLQGTGFYGIVVVIGNPSIPKSLDQHAFQLKYLCNKSALVELGLLNRATRKEYRLTRTLEETATPRELTIRFRPTLQWDRPDFQGDAIRIIPPADVSIEIVHLELQPK